ncbi:MAG: 3-oxoacyl-ACP reductase FabG [Candidatus Aenigmarchaeota archaeon]|nr:3-oxoacyl-ACP reductase FabG [Candidatus Aenigmarchaeota archaeon]
MKLRNKVAIITGSGRGIGKAIAIEFAREGCVVVVNYLHSEEEAMKTVEEIKQIGSDAFPIKADVSKINDVKMMIEKTLEKFGRVDILVNNAGVITRPGDYKNMSEEDFNKTIDVNLKGVYNCIKAVIPAMKKQGNGRIINIASVFGMLGAAPVAAYCAAKAGVINLTKSFAKELAPEILVNCVAPGTIDTEMTRAGGEELIKWISENTPLKRIGNPQEIGKAVLFLASDDSSFITGHTLVVDGGYSLK